MVENVKVKNVKVTSLYNIYKRDIKYLLAVLWLQKCKLPFQSLWYDKWKREIRDYDTVIVFDANLNWQMLSYIKKKNPNVRLIVWYWNTINDENRLDEKYRSLCEIWSFDKKDCERYGIHQNIQFYYPNDIENKCILYDALFVGREKGRMQKLKEICDLLQETGLNVYTYVSRDKKGKGYPEKKILKPIEYKENLKLISQSKCIIDIPKAGQTGMTWRVLESVFYSKKLITTDKTIAEAEFYNPANIFIWDNPDKSELKEFFAIPFEPVDDEILNEYTFETWIKNFGIC